MKNEQQFQEQQAASEEELTQNNEPTGDVNEEVEASEVHAENSEQNENAEMESLRALVEEHQQRQLRTQADFDNFRKRTLKEKEDLAKYASMKLITELLPVVDNFERALTTSNSNSDLESFTKGVEMIFRQLEGVLSAEGLSAMQSVGEPFNPEFHQAIMQVESEEYEEGIVVEEVQKGYMLKDKVLRPAMVKVSM